MSMAAARCGTRRASTLSLTAFETKGADPVKIVIPGGSGQVAAILNRAFTAAGHEVVILTRRPTGAREVWRDGETTGPWER